MKTEVNVNDFCGLAHRVVNCQLEKPHRTPYSHLCMCEFTLTCESWLNAQNRVIPPSA